MTYTKIKNAYMLLRSLCVYRDVLKDPVINRLAEFLKMVSSHNTDAATITDSYGAFMSSLINSVATGNLRRYIAQLAVDSENPFSIMTERGFTDTIITEAASRDLSKLGRISEITLDDFIEVLPEGMRSFAVKELTAWESDDKTSYEPQTTARESVVNSLVHSSDWTSEVQKLIDYHRKHGAGILSRYRAFIPDDKSSKPRLKPVRNPDPVTFSDLTGYESKRQIVIDNTLQLLNGIDANNILLYGDRGTGKSSTVKAVLNEFFHRGLRLVEVTGRQLLHFSHIAEALRDRIHKFIVFVDDLALEDNEENYTALKAALEGGTYHKPSNIVIYATSNRRHLVKERFSERQGDEVRAADTMQEKLSLSDRFGMTVVFSSPDRKGYLQIVENLARKKHLDINKDVLHKEALKWELWYNSRSPRTAHQFISWLEGRIRSCPGKR